VGSFPGPNVTDTMLHWALAAAGASGEAGLLRASCSSCHTTPRSLDPESLRGWIADAGNDSLARLVGESASRGTTPSQLLGGGW
jgi:hypothetical protein